MRRRFHRGGHRPSHDGGTLAVKFCRLPQRIRATSRALRATCLAPARSGHSTSSTASAGGIEPEFVDLRRLLDPVKVDVPHRRVQLLIGLDDREARARHLALVAERGQEAAGQRRLADAERPRQA